MSRIHLLLLPLLFALLPIQSQARDWSTASRRLSSHPMYLSAGLGAQLYVGNEETGDARLNSLTPNLYVEWGYSLTPEIAVAFNLNLFMAQSQTRYRLNPYVDFSQETIDPDGYWPYQSFTFFGGTLTGLLVLDWTNIISGSDMRTKLHISTPVGMGVTVATGAKKNPWTEYSPLNREFSMTTGLAFDYRINDAIALSLTPRLYILRGSLDYSPYSNNESSRLDLIPMVTFGAKFTLNARLPWITR